MRLAGWPLAISLLCAVGWWLIGQFQEKPPPNCDFSCAMANIGWQDSLRLLLFAGGVLSFGMFILACLFFWVSAVVSGFREPWR